jgi:hypothetical protein
MPKNQKTVIVAQTLPVTKAPAWTVLPNSPVNWIDCPHTCECDIDASGVGRVRVKAVYDANIAEIRYGYIGG